MPFNPTAAFGADWDVSTGDLSYDGRGQPNYAYGTDNLAQALYRRFITPKGRLLNHPEYGAGLTQFVDMPMSPANQVQIAALITAQALLDPRVSAVGAVRITPVYQPVAGFVIALQITPTGSADALSLSIPITSLT